MHTRKIAIIGGGIGGLAAGLALQRRGFKISIYERAAEFREFGAGLIVTANARRALRNLGIDAQLEAVSSCVPVRTTCNYITGEIIDEIPTERVVQRYGIASLQVHRADLHRLLLEAVRTNDPSALHAGHTFVSLEHDGGSVSVLFANGASVETDAVIGADGNASSVRSFLFPGESADFNGQVAFRALIPDELVPTTVRRHQMVMHPAPNRYFLHYPLRGGRIMNVIGCGQAAKWEAEGWAIPAQNIEFAAAYADVAPHLLELINSIPAGALFKWGLRDREPLATWVTGRVAMLGDAAHPMTPFLGQGACLAIEDALVIARAFEASATIEEALTRYEAARKSRGNSVQLWSREEGRALQDPSLPRRTAIDRGLLAYDPVTVPV